MTLTQSTCTLCGKHTDRTTATGHVICFDCEFDMLHRGGWRIPDTIQVGGEQLPTTALPEPLRAAVDHIAYTRTVDPAVPYTAYMALLSAICGHRYDVKVNATWIAPLNLYLAVVAQSGDGKSPGMASASKMLARIDQRREEVVRIDRNRAKARMVKVKADLKKAIADEEWDLVVDLERQKEELQKRIDQEAHVSFVDITPEALVDFLESNGELGITLDDEGTVIQHALGLYSQKPNIQLLLRAWDAAPYVSQRRQTKTRQHIHRPILGIAAAVQPTVMNEAAAKSNMNERGLLARFLISWPAPMAGKRLMPTAVTHDEPVDQLHDRIMSMWHDVEQRAVGTLTFDPDALAVFTDWHDEVERELLALDSDAAEQRIAAKVRGSVPRIAGVLHLLQDRPTDMICADDVLRAIQLGNFHRRAARSIDLGVETMHNAQRILEWLIDRGQQLVSTRDELRTALGFHKKGRSQSMYDALNALVDAGWIAPTEGDRFPDAGRQFAKTVPDIECNPYMWKEKA